MNRVAAPTATVSDFLTKGDIVTHVSDPTTEYMVDRQMPKNLAVIRLSDGANAKGPAQGFRKVRRGTAADHAKVASFTAPVETGITEGAVVTLQTTKTRIGSIPTSGLFVVLKMSDKTANVVPLGGITGGQYLRVTPSILRTATITVTGNTATIQG